MNRTIQIIVVDDHPIVAQGINEIVKANLDIECTIDTEFGDVDSGENRLYIVDLELGKSTGFDTIERLLQLKPRVKILVYTMHEEPWVKARIHTLGVDGAVSKNEPVGTLITALKALINNNKFFSPVFKQSHPDEFDNNQPASFSGRERQVLNLLCQGLTSEQIASQLNLSINTVHTYRRRVMEKFNVSNVAELVYQTKGLF